MTRRDDVVEVLGALTISGALAKRAANSTREVGQWRQGLDGRWEPRRWAEVEGRVAALRVGLNALGVVAGDRVGILARSTPEWEDISYAASGARAVVVGVDAHTSAQAAQRMFSGLSVRALVVDDVAAWNRLAAFDWPSLRCVISVAPIVGPKLADAPAVYTLDQVAEIGLRSASHLPWDDAQPDDVATVVFTSGTTGEPKALVYRQRQVIQGVAAILEAFDDLDAGCRIACWLPLAGLFQRMINIAAMSLGGHTYYVEDPRKIMEHLPAIRPQVLIAVPRFLEKVETGVRKQISSAPAWRRAVIGGALRFGARAVAAQSDGLRRGALYRLVHAAADRFVLRRIRSIFGGELRYIVSGSAPTPPWLLEWFHACGVLVLEGYAMSECMIPVASNRLRDYRFGTVGRPMDGVDLRITNDGEIELKSAAVALGYIDGDSLIPITGPDGYLRTGDLGEIDDQGRVRLRGRKSEVFKTSTGRRVAPAPVESELRRIPGVEHAALLGANRKLLVAVLSVPTLDWSDRESAAAALRAAAHIALAPIQEQMRPVGLVVTSRTFSIDAGELTTNLKLRRHRVLEHFALTVEVLYTDLEAKGRGQGFAHPVGDAGTMVMSL